ncbi:hypothetical protein TIFTF001_006470 [Ficus carica]|uniref:Uncharacterized protein n=1 Tax=Ficus carica TaxID=3494 RepID=A0AA87ZN19_FICCA|nr:hypothetical protein TIFTF001_006470 [Ficus carica]
MRAYLGDLEEEEQQQQEQPFSQMNYWCLIRCGEVQDMREMATVSGQLIWEISLIFIKERALWYPPLPILDI